jgi:peptidyl-prolyl cis-trans isomerase B (cyclophilin B)
MTGDPSDTGFGGSGYIFLDEVVADLNFNDPGILSTYARLGPGLNTSTFFISKIPLTGQEGRSIFGKVTSGLEILEKMAVIQNVNSKDDLDRVLSITITEK